MIHPVDAHVGARIRKARAMASKSQAHVADELGISFQQLQKYEKGRNRVGSSRLYELSEVLGVPVSWFFSGYDDENDEVVSNKSTEAAKKEAELNRLLALVAGIESQDFRDAVISLIKAYSREEV